MANNNIERAARALGGWVDWRRLLLVSRYIRRSGYWEIFSHEYRVSRRSGRQPWEATRIALDQVEAVELEMRRRDP